jgi:hypothetical protein
VDTALVFPPIAGYVRGVGAMTGDDWPNRRWAQYVANVIRGLNNKTAAQRAHVAPGTVANWLDPSWQGRPSSEAVNKFARGFGLDPVEAGVDVSRTIYRVSRKYEQQTDRELPVVRLQARSPSGT